MKKILRSRRAKRLLIISFLFILGFLQQYLFVSLEQHEIGALLFVAILTGGLLYYYTQFLKDKHVYRFEFFMSILVGLLTTIFVFAIIYSSSCHDDSCFLVNGKEHDLNFVDALYFSTSTLTTLGYGDIVPLDLFRLYAMIEVLLGIFYTGTIIYLYTKFHENWEDN